MENIDNNNETILGARASAIRILSRFERSDSYIEKLIDNEIKNNNFNELDKSLLNEIVNGVIRWRGKLDWVLVGFYQGDYLKCLNIVKNSMRVALYQILFLDKIPTHAAINESVEIVKRIQGEKAAGIVNGVLRNIARNLESIRYPEKEEDIAYYLTIMYSHPRWMVRRWLDRFGEKETENLLFANNRRPYIPLRVNLIKSTIQDVEKYLTENEMLYYQSPYFNNTLIVKFLKKSVTSLEIFKNGFISIQDPSASLALNLSLAKAGDKVIDLCSAPGSKAFYLAELMNNQGTILALDKYKFKLKQIEEGAQRLGIKIISTLCADSRNYESNEKFNIVIADVPCSGTGTISKKPDIKWKREREDIQDLVALQREILNNAANLVTKGGVIIYSTCSIEAEENFENIEWFLNQHPNFSLDPAEKYLPERVCKDGYFQTFPHIHFIDGAFAARLIKNE